MSYTVYVSDTASYVASTLDRAMDLAEPFIGLGRPVEIRYSEVNLPGVVWHFDYNTFDWAQMRGRSGSAIENVLGSCERR